MSRRSIVLAVAPSDSSVDLSDLVQRLKATELPSKDIVWHSHKFRNPKKVQDSAPPAEADEEDDSHFRLIVSCSVPESAKESEDIIPAHLMSTFSDEIAEIEVWMTAPCPVPIEEIEPRVLMAQGGDDQDSLEANAQGLRKFGLLAFENSTGESNLQPVLTAVHNRIQEAEKMLRNHHPQINVGKDLFAFSEMSSRGGQRFDLLFDCDLLPPAIEELANHGSWVPTVRFALGEDYKCAVSIVYSRPGAEDQDWHSDGKHIGPVADWNGREAAAAYAVCVFMPLIDLDYCVGFTQYCTEVLGSGFLLNLRASGVSARRKGVFQHVHLNQSSAAWSREDADSPSAS